MTKPLAGKAALVTGAAKRIGRAIALALAEAGADVAITYRNSAGEAERTADELRALGVTGAGGCGAMCARRRALPRLWPQWWRSSAGWMCW